MVEHVRPAASATALPTVRLLASRAALFSCAAYTSSAQFHRRSRNRSNRITPYFDGAGQVASEPSGVAPPGATANAPEHYAASIQIIERRLLERPDDIRAAARSLADAFKEPNEPRQLAQYQNLRDFFEQMAAGLADLADALDRAFSSATGSPASSPEPIFLGKAAEIARWLQNLTHRWLEEIGTDVIGVPVRIGLLLIEFNFHT